MAHGAPDWWGIAPKQQTYTLQDMAELAARMDAPNKWERRGDTLWFQTFERGMKAILPSVTGPLCEYYLSNDYPYHGNTCMHLVSGDTDADHAGFQYTFPTPTLGCWGAQSWYAWGSNVEYIRLHFWYYDGSDCHAARIRYDPVNTRLELMKEIGFYETIDDDLDLWSELFQYNVFKLVVDFENLHYVRIIVNGNTYDVSEFGLWHFGATVESRIGVTCELENVDGATAEANVDSIILTINEPA